ncbi:MAG: ribonuclease HII [Pseudomonadota bacterium]
MDHYWSCAIQNNYQKIAGVDEAGRGCLAGPVVASAVIILPENISKIRYLTDSKKISAKKREIAFEDIKKYSLSFGISISNEEEIDKINILNASLLAMKRAVMVMDVRPDYLLIDGNQKIQNNIDQEAIIGGDLICPLISAASIVAKVTRDNLMLEYDKKYPQYGFAKHKGYGTKDHKESIKKHGVSELHRLTFKGVSEHVKKVD